jgi:hypothetical protein
LQGSVAGLRAVVADRDPVSPPDWATAAGYTERLQAMIRETVGPLGDNTAGTSYELTGYELADIIRRRNGQIAKDRDVLLEVTGGFDHGLGSHHGSLLCLITSNLVQNAIEAREAGRRVTVGLLSDDKAVTLLVADDGTASPSTSVPTSSSRVAPGESEDPDWGWPSASCSPGRSAPRSCSRPRARRERRFA